MAHCPRADSVPDEDSARDAGVDVDASRVGDDLADAAAITTGVSGWQRRRRIRGLTAPRSAVWPPHVRREIARALRRRFTRRLRRTLPEFRERKVRAGLRGTVLYEWRPLPALTCYIALVIDQERERFDVELAWSRGRGFPAHLRTSTPAEAMAANSARLHLRSLWQRWFAEPGWLLEAPSEYELSLERDLADPAVPDARKAALLDAHEALGRRKAGEPPANADDGPLSATEAIARIEGALDDVMARIERFARPVLRDLLERATAAPAAPAAAVPQSADAPR